MWAISYPHDNIAFNTIIMPEIPEKSANMAEKRHCGIVWYSG